MSLGTEFPCPVTGDACMRDCLTSVCSRVADGIEPNTSAGIDCSGYLSDVERGALYGYDAA